VVDLFQGRIGKNVFLRFYFKPDFKAVADKVLNIIRPLEDELLD